jgi:hypothetical protein
LWSSVCKVCRDDVSLDVMTGAGPLSAKALESMSMTVGRCQKLEVIHLSMGLFVCVDVSVQALGARLSLMLMR